MDLLTETSWNQIEPQLLRLEEELCAVCRHLATRVGPYVKLAATGSFKVTEQFVRDTYKLLLHSARPQRTGGQMLLEFLVTLKKVHATLSG